MFVSFQYEFSFTLNIIDTFVGDLVAGLSRGGNGVSLFNGSSNADNVNVVLR